MDDSPSLRPGQLIDGKYEIIGLLGSGSMGLVYRAKHTTLNRTVALKTLRDEIATDEELVGRFQQEARAAGALGHPNIVQIFDAGQTFSGLHYMVMEQLDGESLYEMMEHTPLFSPSRAVGIMDQVLSALSMAHRRGIVHRDLKPENIFLAETDAAGEQVKLLDFGISKVLERAEEGIRGADVVTRATKIGVVMGTPLYMSPEQARGETDIDHRADLWSTACVLYEMMCGKTPYDGDNYNQVMVSILDDDFEMPRRLRADIPPALEAVILRGKAYEREKRYPDADAMRKELLSSVPGVSQTRVQGFVAEVPPPLDTLALGSGTPAPELLANALSLAKADAALSEDDAKMLSAFDNLDSATVATLDDEPDLAEIGVASTITPVPGTLAAVGAAPKKDALELPDLPDLAPALGEPPATSSAFDPPAVDQSTDQPLALDDDSRFAAPEAEFAPSAVELREDVLRQVAPGRSASPPPRRHQPGTMYRSRGAGIGGILTWLLVLAILGGGAFAGYRYYTLGYLLPPDSAVTTKIEFSIVPADAEVLIDGEPLMTRPFDAEPGTEYTITMRAEGRLRVERKVSAEEGQTRSVGARLPLAVSTIDEATAKSYDAPQADPSGAAKASYVDIDGALQRLDLYAQCLRILAEPVSSSEEAYTKSTRTRITRKSLPIVVPIDTKLGLECQTLLDVAKAREPKMNEIDELAQSYIDSLGQVMKVLVGIAGYYESEQYLKDRLKKGRKAHTQLQKRFAELIRLQRELVSKTLGARRRWQVSELAALEADEGRSTHWHARRLMLASQEWVLSEVGRAPKTVRETRRAEFDDAFVSAQEHVRNSAVEGVRGARQYVSSVGAVAAQEGEDSLRWHNDSVILFNKIVISESPDPQ